MRILILGGDGYLGWPTAMHLSASGHQIAVADNYLRRHLQLKEDVEALIKVPSLGQRTRLWQACSGYHIANYIGDLTTWDFISQVFASFQPEAIIHYAEQPSAPYSMLNHKSASLTLHNNLQTTLNLVYAVKTFCPTAHIVKLGTMGEYGTPNIDIEEGWLDIEHKGRSDRFLFPRQGPSLYHTTKIMDTDLLWFYVRAWGIRVTDLMQGLVYGVFTDENRDHDALLPFFCYDGIFGTVINRFVVQAVSGYPLTVYGSGSQTRSIINILDTVNCIRLCVESPAEPGKLRIFNQFAEISNIIGLAHKVQQAAATLGLEVPITHLQNPRTEAAEHYYNPSNQGLLELGLAPHELSMAVLIELLKFVKKHQKRISEHVIHRGLEHCAEKI